MSPKSKLVSQWISRFFTGMWTRVTYRHRNVSKTAASLKPTISWVTAHQSWESGAHCTHSRHQQIGKHLCQLAWASSRKLICFWFLLGIPAVPCFLWATRLRVVFRSLCCFFLFSESGSHFIFCIDLGCAIDQIGSIPNLPACVIRIMSCNAPPVPVCWLVCFVFSVLRNGLVM